MFALDLLKLFFNPLALQARFFTLHLGGGSSPPPPDYTPVANASKEAAELSTALGREQLAENRRQYEESKAIAAPVVAAQLETMRQGIDQGKDYYEYGKSFRPLEQGMMKMVMENPGADAETAERNAIVNRMDGNATELRNRTKAYEAEAKADTDLYTGGNSGIYNKYRDDIEGEAGLAAADAREGQSQAQNSAIRQAMRYGLPVGDAVAGVGLAGAQQIASAVNNTRTNAVNNYRNIVGQGIDIKRANFGTGQAATTDAMTRGENALQTGRNMRVQDESIRWARGLDVAGMARGMPGASTGAYGVATAAGNSAVQNQMAPGQALVNNMTAGNNTIMNGRSIAMSGLNSALSSQSSLYNAGQSSNGQSMGAIIGGGATIGAAMI